MKKSLRFASAALALTLAAGCAMPAFAAGKSSFSKSETVYAVMNGDGSIKSTTVSEHLYSASGLANVTDKTTLTDIQNTESDAEFTQNGEELVWNTNDTDVYYKGNTDKALPIDVKVTYALDGQEAVLEDIIGKSGHLTVTVNLKNWQIYTLSDSYQVQKNMKYVPLKDQKVPGCYRATFNLKKTGDTFLNLETWGKGQVYVNGHAIGRFWKIGPQQTLYMPGCWLKKGENEIIVQDIVGPQETVVEGLSKPIIDKLNVDAPNTHRKEGQTLNLAGETPCKAGEFAPGNGWQEVRFDQPVTGRYVCIEALNSHNNREYACIAEWYMLNDKGQRISREPWTVAYADDEDISSGNKTADKIFDLQESTYWSTNKDVKFPHYIVLDLGAEQTLGGFQYLPRVEQGAPESIKGYTIYVKSQPFKF